MDFIDWHDFFVATVGGAAGLTGLIFVGVSINITRILANSKLPERALLSIFLLLNILVVSCTMLIPKQSPRSVGLEMTILALFIYISITILDIGIYKASGEYRGKYLISMLFNQLSLVPFVGGGIGILIAGDEGVYWLALGIILSFTKAVIDAWVLLVEINR